MTSFYDLMRRSRRGRLKVYIGMIAGVGKTYRMLQEAHSLLARGVDVRIGEIVTHGRAETEDLVAGIPAVPLKELFYKGRLLRELDLEAVVAARPQVVLVDELAHTNAPGSRNAKRYQDVLELLGENIHVITAVNVQHLESLSARVERITGVRVTETIPDKFLEEADEVVNIDLPAEELIQRLRDGKIYPPQRAATALENFFREESILHLRDLALRTVAERVEHAISRSPTAPRLAEERFLACVTTNDAGAKRVLRKTARLAAHYQADWDVLHVQTAREHPDRIDLAVQRLLLANLRWAAEQGARTIQEPGEDVPATIRRVAEREGTTTLVIGRPGAVGVLDRWRGSLFHRLIEALSDTEIDVVVVA